MQDKKQSNLTWIAWVVLAVMSIGIVFEVYILLNQKLDVPKTSTVPFPSGYVESTANKLKLITDKEKLLAPIVKSIYGNTVVAITPQDNNVLKVWYLGDSGKLDDKSMLTKAAKDFSLLAPKIFNAVPSITAIEVSNYANFPNTSPLSLTNAYGDLAARFKVTRAELNKMSLQELLTNGGQVNPLLATD